MSNKLTKEMIDALIQEAMLQERFPNAYTAAELDALDKGKKLAKDLAGLETDTRELAPNDIRKAFASGDPDKVKKVVKLKNTKGLDATLKSDLDDIIDDLGGELDTTQKRMKTDSDKITQIAGDIDIGTGVSPEASALTGKGPTGKVPNIKVSKSVIEQMKLFDSPSAAGKFQQLQEVATKVANKQFPQDTQEMFKFITQANVLNYFGNMAKASSGIEAGFEFEKFCVVFMNGFQVGGANGAADVFLALKNGQVVPTSQKFYSDIKNVKQSNKGQGQAGLYYLLNQPDVDEIYYFVGIKEGGNTAAEYTNLKMYIIKITQDGSHFYGQSMGPEGSYTSPEKLGEFTLDKKNGKSRQTHMFPQEGGKDYSEHLATIPILNNPSADTAAIAEYMSGQMTAGDTEFADFSKAVVGIFASLKKMEKNTQIYNAKQGQGRKSDASSYVNEIAVSYVALRDDYNHVFGVAGETKKLAENKMTELDLMVENMVKQFLKGN